MSENTFSKQNNYFDILTKSFRPLIDQAYKEYVKEKYIPIVNKIDSDRSQIAGIKTDMELLYEKFFKKSNSNSPKRSPRKNPINKKQIKKKQSFLLENNIIEKKDIYNNPCNKKYIRICKTPDASIVRKKEFYERELIFKKNKETKNNQLRHEFESKALSELKPSPGIISESKKILEKNNLIERSPLHMRYKDIFEEKKIKLKSMQRNLNRDNSANSIIPFNTFNNTILNNNHSKKLNTQEDNNYNINYNSNISTNNYNSNISIKNNNTNHNRANSSLGINRSRSYNKKEFGNWLESNNKWNKIKEAKTENLKNMYEKMKKENEDKNTKFSPAIDENSQYIAKQKNQNDNLNLNIYDKLYSLHAKKKENIQNLQQKYKPSFKPNINKFPQYLPNNSNNPNITKSFYIEEKEDDYANFISGVKNIKLKTDYSSTKPSSKYDKILSKENIEFRKFKKEVEKNHYVIENKKSCRKSKKEIEDFFLHMNKGISPNCGLEINDIKFYNEIQKN